MRYARSNNCAKAAQADVQIHGARRVVQKVTVNVEISKWCINVAMYFRKSAFAWQPLYTSGRNRRNFCGFAGRLRF